jgi:acetoacetyl-CoA synthetase
VWSHGDFAELTAFGGIVIHGRSDATLNPGGIRLGTGDYYDVVEKIPSVVDSIVVAQKTSAAAGSFDGDERVLLFVKLAAGQRLTTALQQEISSQIRTNLSPKHVPALVIQVQNIPVNANMKKLEILTRRAIEGEPLTPAMLQQLASPELLDEYLGFTQHKYNSKL